MMEPRRPPDLGVYESAYAKLDGALTPGGKPSDVVAVTLTKYEVALLLATMWLAASAKAA